MKTNFVQVVFIGSLIVVSLSCKKNIDQPLAEEDAATTPSLSAHEISSPKERPFRGQIVGTFTSTPGTDPAVYNSAANASGNVTHLGFFNKVTSDIINLISSTVEGTFIMTSVTGEQISGRYSGTFAFGSTPGTFSWILNATITGGSGRFANATGEFVFTAEGNYSITDGIVSGDYTESFDGTIIY